MFLQNSPISLRRLVAIAAGFLLIVPNATPSLLADEQAGKVQIPGQRIFTAGHSFHVWMPAILTEIAAQAKIEGHKQLGLQGLGGSQVIQHWNLPEGKNTVKPALMTGNVQVLTLSPIYLPDEGIEKLTKLGLEHNPDLRVTVQEFWLPFDEQALWQTRPKQVDRDSKTIEVLRAAHADYFKTMDELVVGLNKEFGKQVIFVVPVGQAVLALREKIIKGEVPGVEKQSQLFNDVLGHPKPPIQALAGYCHFAVIYRQNPVGLPVPTVLANLPEAEKLTRLLQELSWDAVTNHPLSGMK